MRADKPGSDAPHYHLQQREVVRVKAGKLGYFVGHQHHVQAAEAGEEVAIQPGARGWGMLATLGMGVVEGSLREGSLRGRGGKLLGGKKVA